MEKTLKYLKKVRHRIDDLENKLQRLQCPYEVRHRIDDLEIT
ncbi:hypothetical protein [Acinetobacter bereziniae]|nr:hypothetical protein [Acinetobacter bereziniae]